MKNVQLFAMLMLLSTGFVMQAESGTWHARHENRVFETHEGKLERYLNDKSMSHGELSRFIDHTQDFVKDLQRESKESGRAISEKECALASKAFSDITERFEKNKKYANLRSSIEKLGEGVIKLEEKQLSSKMMENDVKIQSNNSHNGKAQDHSHSSK